MSAYPPPLYSFSGLNFNPTIFETIDTFTQDEANLLYLQKTVADTATAVETFNAGIITTTRTSGDNTTYGASTAFVTSAISALSSIYQTAAQVTTAITSYGYQTAAQVTTAITSYGYQTAAQVTTAITSYGYQTAAQVTTAINSALVTFLTVTHTYTASQLFNGTANTINGAGIMSVNGLTSNVIVRLGSAAASTSPGTTVSFGFTFGANPRVFVTNNTSTQQISSQVISTTNFRLVSGAGTPTCNWMAVGVSP
jgi:hypothetical protein